MEQIGWYFQSGGLDFMVRYSSYGVTIFGSPSAQTYLDPLEKQYRELLELRERVRKAEAAAQLIGRGLRHDPVFFRRLPARRRHRRIRVQSPHDPDPRQHGVAAALGD
jgi:hypothetical protein